MMQAFLQSLDENIWNIVENGWEHPIKPVESKTAEGSSAKTELKPRSEWLTYEIRDYNNDVKARHSLFTALSKREKKRIGMCKTAKKAWDILQVTYEGNKRVRAQKLQRLTQEFENMSMRDDESIDDFHSRLINVTNDCDSLGDPIAEHRIVKKFLRSLPLSFQNKQIAIEEAQDLDTYSLDELLGNLQTFEMKIKPDRNMKNIALNTVEEEKEKETEDTSDFSAEDFAILAKQFKKFVRSGNSFQDVKNPYGSSSLKNLSKDFSFEKDTKTNRFSQKKAFSDKPKCFECQGFGHLAADCGNRKYKARSSRALQSTWSDTESENHSENEDENIALTVALLSNSSCDSDDDEHNNEEWADKYEEMCRASTKMIKINEDLNNKLTLMEKEKNEITDRLKSHTENWEIERTACVDRIKNLQDNLNAQICLVNSLSSDKEKLEFDLHESQEKFSKFSIGSDKMSKMIGIGKTVSDKRGLGYTSDMSVKENKPTRFVKGSEIFNSVNLPHSRRFIPICHYCGILGHIRPKCHSLGQSFQRFKVPQKKNQSQSLQEKLKEHLREVNRITKLVSIPKSLDQKVKQVWVKRGSHISHFTSVNSPHTVSDLFTKPLDNVRFESLRNAIGVCSNF